jgi:uncharacterized membrane protein YhdT
MQTSNYPETPNYPDLAEPRRRTVTVETVSPSARAIQIVYIVFGLIEALIAFRVVLKLLAANPNAGFSALIYTVTWPFVAPFQGVFPTPATNGSVFEFSSVLAIIVYALISWVIVQLIQIGARRRTTTTAL